jgi:succinate-acetate transporter protein
MSEKVVNKLSVANPTGLGLFGLAIVTFVAASQKLGITTGLSYVIVYAMFLGATAQLIACIFDFFHENIWGATVFGAYAFFWYAIATCWLMNMGAFGPALQKAVDIKQSVCFPRLPDFLGPDDHRRDGSQQSHSSLTWSSSTSC